MERRRLEDEFRKLKELKRKAEQYAIEAKQTAQRLSAENSKLRDDLSRERRHNELTRTNIIRETILKQSVSVNLLHLAVTGLPGSGKSVLLQQILKLSQPIFDLRVGGKSTSRSVSTNEAIVCYDQIQGSHVLIDSTDEGDGVMAISFALVQHLSRVHNAPLLTSTDSTMDLDDCMFSDPNVSEHFKTVVSRFQKLTGQLETTGVVDMLKTNPLSLISLGNTGVSKTAQEVFYTLASRCNNQVLLNLLNLKRDVPENFIVPPSFSDTEVPVDGIKPVKMVQFQSALQCFKRATFVASKACERESVLVVGTHTDKLNPGKVYETKNYVEQITMGCAENAGIADTVCPGIEWIHTNDENDCKRVQDRLLKMVYDEQAFQCDVPLRYVFLRCYLQSSKQMFISRRKLTEEAHKCGVINEEEIEQFLKIFNSCGSIVYSIDGEFPLLKDYIILNPHQFIKALDCLQDINAKSLNDKPELFKDVQATRLGFISQKLADYLWPEEGEGKMTQAHFVISVLKELKFILPTKELQIDSKDLMMDEEKLSYFVPTLRPDFDTTEPTGDSNSLFITYNDVLLPFNFSTDVILHLLDYFGAAITFDPKPFHNSVTFRWHDDREQRDANVTIRFLTEQVEVSVKFLNQAPRMSTVTKLFSQLKSACVQLFQQLSSKINEFDYKFAVVCPLSNEKVSHTHKAPPTSKKIHFIAFSPLSTGEEKLFCRSCKEFVPSEKLPQSRLLWTQVAYRGPSMDTLSQDGELSQWVKVISSCFMWYTCTCT